MYNANTQLALAADSPSPYRSREDKVDLFLDKLLAPLAIGLLVTVWVLFEWGQSQATSQSNLWLPLVIAAIAACHAVWQCHKHWPRMTALLKAEDYRAEVSVVLDGLRSEGWQVCHDFRLAGLQIEHVLVGPPGVFVVRTVVPEDGPDLATGVGACQYNEALMAEVRGSGELIRALLADSAGRRMAVKGVVLCDALEGRLATIDDGIIIAAPQVFAAAVRRRKAVFNPHDVTLVAYHVSEFARPRCHGGNAITVR